MTKRLLSALAVVAALLFIFIEAVTAYTTIQTARKAKAEADLATTHATAASSTGNPQSSGNAGRQLLASPPSNPETALEIGRRHLKELQERDRAGQP